MPDASLAATYAKLKTVLSRHADGLVVLDEFLGSEAKVKKVALHLYGAKEVSIGGRKPQLTYIAGIIWQKSFVGFYHMPVYSHPEEFQLSATLTKARKGKSCFHIKANDPAIIAELEVLLNDGIELYRVNGWI